MVRVNLYHNEDTRIHIYLYKKADAFKETWDSQQLHPGSMR